MARFKDVTMQRCYEAAQAAGADPASDFFCSPLGVDGPRCPRNGAGHRDYYWKGRAGIERCAVPGSSGYAFWAAGRDDAKRLGAIHPKWVTLGIRGAGLATRAQLQDWLLEAESRLPWSG